ncbi:GEVED domain-containing protein [Hydrocarboniphaga sp.]|uniref:GEVED domain-containing protein n=1 Tax=Hydrocarboniphaga sp. TaxID=2033016 RepID=UPI003D101300
MRHAKKKWLATVMLSLCWPSMATAASADVPSQQITAAAWAGIQQQIARAQYEAAPPPADPATVSAHNPKQDLRLSFSRAGSRFESLRNRSAVGQIRDEVHAENRQPLKLQTTAFARGLRQQPAEAVPPVADGARVEYRRDGWTEWFINSPGGIEHGYTLNRRPVDVPAGVGSATEPLKILLSVDGMQAANGMRESLRFTAADGRRLRYEKLIATDANGRTLPSTMSAPGADRIEIAIDDSDARYPVTVDPLLVNEEQAITNPADWPNYSKRLLGSAIAMTSGTLLVGAPEALGFGAAYIFTSDGSAWTLQQRLTSDNARVGDNFGSSVALSGDSALVGALGAHEGQGSAYVFVHSGTHWVQQARLKPSISGSGDHFGSAVSIEGDLALVGNRRLRAFMFARSGSIWTEQLVMTTTDGYASNTFGQAVALSGDTAIVGAPGDCQKSGSAYVFVRTSSTQWPQQAKFKPKESGCLFGGSISFTGDTALIGVDASDVAAYLYSRSGSAWAEQAKLVAGEDTAPNTFTASAVALSGDTAIVGVLRGFGAAYVFHRDGLNWPLQSKLVADDSATQPYSPDFGAAVAIVGDTAVVSAPRVDGLAEDEGAAYVFARSGTTWTQQSKLMANDGAYREYFGTSIAISGDTALVGVPGDSTDSIANQGAAYVYVHTDTGWKQQAKLTIADAMSGDFFGSAVALDGDTALVGASGRGDFDEGGGYVFVRTGPNWTLQAALSAAEDPGAVPGLNFGSAVALSGDKLLIGATGFNGGQGAAYVFGRSGSLWTQQAKLIPSKGGSFGAALALSSDTAVIGAPLQSNGDKIYQGAAYIYVASGSQWKLQQQLSESSSGERYDNFGNAVALSGDAVLIGVPGDGDTGSAYLYQRSDGKWQQAQTFRAINGALDDAFGTSVAFAGDAALIGANRSDVDGKTDQGAAYLFLRTSTGWEQQSKLTAADGAASDQFGSPVGLSGAQILIGAPQGLTAEGQYSGSVHFFRIGTDYGDAPSPYATLVADNGPRHFINTDGPFLGSGIDAETDGQPNSGATGDDIATSDDEDGVTIAKLIPGQNAKAIIVVTAPGGTAQLDAWIDFNADGDWSDAGEQVFTKTVVSNGSNTLKFTVPTTAVVGQTYARFRISPANSGGVKATGKVIFGEVEDYIVKVKTP